MMFVTCWHMLAPNPKEVRLEVCKTLGRKSFLVVSFGAQTIEHG